MGYIGAGSCLSSKMEGELALCCGFSSSDVRKGTVGRGGQAHFSLHADGIAE